MACAPTPLALPIGNVSLSNGQIARGVPLEIGTPAQQFAFMPRVGDNNTSVFDSQSDCGNHTTAYCVTLRGGIYNAGGSSTSKPASSDAAAGGSPDSDPGVWVTDDLALSSNVMESSFPIEIGRPTDVDYYTPQSWFGLGTNSTILTALKKAGTISSRTWSMFWGETGAANSQQSNGTFVFGGYDAAKISGSNYTKQLNTASACGTGMLVTLSDIRMQYPNGTNPSLYASSLSTAIDACIAPDFPGLMTLPVSFFDVFEEICQCSNIGRSFGYNFYDMLYDPSEPTFDGALVLEIDSLISITIPNSQLLVPEVSIRSDGSKFANYSSDELLINSIQSVNANDLPILGRQFLSAAMVMVNQDANQFTLWQASASSSQSLVAVDSQGHSVPTLCAGTSGTNGTNSTGSTTPTYYNNSSSSNTGAIAGGVVGGIVALIAILVLAWFLVRRKRRNRKLAQPGNLAPPGESHEFKDDAGVYNPDVKPPTPPCSDRVYEVEGMRSPVEMQGSTWPSKANSVPGVHELG